MPLSLFLQSIFRGVGQVMFQKSALSGAVMLAGIFYNSWQLALGAILGNLIGSVTALLLRYSKTDIADGLYGFNGTLVGIAVGCLFRVEWVSFVLLVVGASLSSVLMHLLRKRITPYTSPFILCTWLILLGVTFTYPTALLGSTPALAQEWIPFQALCVSIGQVMFQADEVAGMLFLLAIALNSRVAACYTLWGAVAANLFAFTLAVAPEMANMGLIGYNAVLCSLALGDKSIKGFTLATLGILLSVILQLAALETDINPLTAPFVLATWVILVFRKVN